MGAPKSERVVGRYVVYAEIASGGMGAVHFGRLLGSAGFHRVVAVKRLHPQHARDPELVASFVDEARLASRIRHPNVAATLDVVQEGDELCVVMEYVHGESLARLAGAAHKRGERIPERVAAAIVHGALAGLEAAHGAVNERGEPLGLVHRDVSPENVLVGVDGVARVVDFGIALAEGRSQATREGRLKGKLAYMAPELFDGERATPRSDVYSAGVVLWEALTGVRLFTGENEGAILRRILRGDVPPPSAVVDGLSLRADALVLRALSRAPADRHASAAELARALEDALPVAPTAEVGAWVARVAATSLAARARVLSAIENEPTPAHAGAPPRPAPPPTPTTTPSMTTGIATITPAVPTATPSPSPSPASRRALGALALGVPFVLAALGVLARVASTSSPRAEVVGLPLAADASASADAAPDASDDVAPDAAVDEAPREQRPETPEPAVPVRSAAPRPRRPLAPWPSPKPGAAPNCSPPYTVDDKGIHHYKPACL